MALTKEQWFRRLKSWVPGWVFEEEGANVAIFEGIARLLELMEQDRDFLFDQTMIDDSESPFLDLLGDERNVRRNEGESTSSYRLRVKSKSIRSNINRPAIETIISSFVSTGLLNFVEDFEGTLYCDREYFCDRGEILIDPIDTAFSVVVDENVESSIVDSLVTTLNREKAFGVAYRMIQRHVAITTLITEEGDVLTTEGGDELLLG
jgi:hypothetical protein